MKGTHHRLTTGLISLSFLVLCGCATVHEPVAGSTKESSSRQMPPGYSPINKPIPNASVPTAADGVSSTPTRPNKSTFGGNGSDSEIALARKKNRTTTPRMRRHRLEHDGIEREYFEFAPQTTDGLSTLPTLIFMHGYGGTATGVQAETTNGLNRYAQHYGYRVIYPQGTWFVSTQNGRAEVITSWNDLGGSHETGPKGPLCAADAAQYPCPPECGSCGRCHWTSCHDDVGFLQELLARLSARSDVDSNQVFISGFSNGSMMAQRMACLAPQKFKAVALVGGRLEVGFGCAPSSMLALLQISGGKDSVVPVAGRIATSDYYYQSADEVDQAWANANSCTTPVAARSMSNVATSVMACRSRCAGSPNEVTQCLWFDGGHRWPGSPEGHGSNGYCVTNEQKDSVSLSTPCVQPDVTTDVWGSRVLFEFFEQHR